MTTSRHRIEVIGGSHMSGNKKWVNPHSKTRRSKTKMKKHTKRKDHSLHHKNKQTLPTQKKASTVSLGQHSSNPSSLIDQLHLLSENIDLVKMSHKLAEVNQVVEQVNGLFSQLNIFNMPSQVRVRPTPLAKYPTKNAPRPQAGTTRGPQREKHPDPHPNPYWDQNTASHPNVHISSYPGVARYTNAHPYVQQVYNHNRQFRQQHPYNGIYYK